MLEHVEAAAGRRHPREGRRIIVGDEVRNVHNEVQGVRDRLLDHLDDHERDRPDA
jgi:hypothetical protein